jgi:hypothetical protein
MPRTVIAHTAIRNGDLVVVNTVTHEARPAEGGTRKIALGDRHQLAKALTDIAEGQQGSVEDLPDPS